MSKTTKRKKAINEQIDDGKIRLNKYLAEAGVASRRKSDELIKEGVVKVNGKIIVDLGTKIDKDAKVTVHGDFVKSDNKFVYILLNKPKDCITTTSDEKDRKTVMSIINTRARVFPVGRLDRNTTGVLLITNDGELTHRLTHPKYQIERIYSVGIDKELKVKDAKNIAKGIELEDGLTAPCEIFIDPKDKTQISVSLTEGKNHEIKRLFESLGYQVKKLDRKYFAGLSNTGMNRGEYRILTQKEILSLRKLVNLK